VSGNKNLLNLLSIVMIILLLIQIFIGVCKSVFMLNTGQKIDARLIYFVTNRLNKKRERKLMEDNADLESQLEKSFNSVKTIKQFWIEDFANIKTENRFICLLE
jgi:ATP-binding cassette subfamily B protein